MSDQSNRGDGRRDLAAIDLNALEIEGERGPEFPLADFGCEAAASVRIHFRDLAGHLCGYIRSADFVCGAVAWLTNEPILEALATVPDGVSIVVQKEDFLRPDLGSGQPVAWRRRLHELYRSLPEAPMLLMWDSWLGGLSYCSTPEVGGVRCLGNHNRDRAPAFPRMHHKFLVFCKVEERPRDGSWGLNRDGEGVSFRPVPYAVWTGSFNFTRNSEVSLENAVVIGSPAVAQAYYSEWEQLLAVSEPLDWFSEWAEPEWRLGS